MNREDILKKAQSTKPNRPDEMELQILQAGSRFGMGVGMLVCVVLMFVKMAADQPWSDVYAIYCAMVAAQWGYKYCRLRQRQDLINTVLWTLVALILLGGYLFIMLR
jgi:hypothetical protein